MQALDFARSIATKILSDRPALAPRHSGMGTPFAGGGSFGASPKFDVLTTSGVLFACVNLICNAMAKSQWTVNRTNREGDLVAVKSSLLGDVWVDPNPDMTRWEFMYTSFNHFEIAGEIFWLIVKRGPGGPPVELVPLRPDRMSVLPAPTGEVQGYIYRIGSEEIPLAPDCVIFIKRPSASSAYRGVGVVEAILTEIDTDRMASRWSRNFYTNGALPGGIIKLEEKMSRTDWDTFVDRWRQQHQGVQNAHRIAVLERADFVPMRFTQNDMQFIESRNLSRDNIMIGFGIHRSLIGIPDDVNLANAETADENFADFVQSPRLEMIKQSLNKHLVPAVPQSASLTLDYKDPKPSSREADIKEGSSGYLSGILTLDEARKRYGEASVPGGDQFRDIASNIGAGKTPPLGLGVSGKDWDIPILRADKALPGQDDVSDAADAMQLAWEQRLVGEVEALIRHLEGFNRSATLASWTVTKFEPSDIESFDWDWLAKYGAAVEEELSAVFFETLISEFGEIDPSEAQRLSADYARTRGADLLKLEGDLSVTVKTRQRVRDLTAKAIQDGDSLNQLAKTLREDFDFSPERARVISRTETATALGQGEREASLKQGRNEKRWVTQGDDRVDAGDLIQECLDNEAQGWIPINELFSSGKMTAPEHPNCRCRVRSRTKPVDDDVARGVARVAEARCPDCKGLMGKNQVTGELLWCRKCKEEKVVV